MRLHSVTPVPVLRDALRHGYLHGPSQCIEDRHSQRVVVEPPAETICTLQDSTLLAREDGVHIQPLTSSTGTQTPVSEGADEQSQEPNTVQPVCGSNSMVCQSHETVDKSGVAEPFCPNPTIGKGGLPSHGCLIQRMGGHTDTRMASGLWTLQESRFPLNLLEMEAVIRVMKVLLASLRGRHVTSCGDNVTCLSYLHKQGGTKSKRLSLRAEEILKWMFSQGITISTEFIPGKLNVLANLLSRPKQILATEWTIARQTLEPVWTLYSKPMVDLFATEFSNRLNLYMSPIKDPKALGRDAFSISWLGMEAYAYPPHSTDPESTGEVSLRSSQTHPSNSGIRHTNPDILRLTAWLLSPTD